MSSLLKQQGEGSHEAITNFGSFDELCGVCAIMKIPFVVIVQPHMLKDKGKVRLRHVLKKNKVNSSERLVSVENLARTISEFDPSNDISQYNELAPYQYQKNCALYRDGVNKMKTSIECVYVTSDQFFDRERSVAKLDTAQFKSAIKTIRSITQRAESFVQSMVHPCGGSNLANDLPVFVVTGLSFWCLREFSNLLMRNQCCTIACLKATKSYPNEKRCLKTLGLAIDCYLERNNFTQDRDREVIMLLYSKMDDKFDLVTL